jgi:predicted component of type VI protein secretion system
MSYRIVILNGDGRGERHPVEATPLVIGKSAGCQIRISEPECAETHAEVSLRGGDLFIRSLGEAPAFLVNETASRESGLKHGDVIQIGSTRFFVHEVSGQKGWEALFALRRRQAWLKVIIPILLVAGLAMVVNRFRNQPPVTPSPAPAAATAPEPVTPLPDDTVVTNIPRIQIDPSITLTTRPPDLVEAVTVLEHSSADPDPGALEAARAELEAGARFLEKKSNPALSPAPGTTRDTSAADLTQAEESLRKEASSTAPPTVPATRDTPAATHPSIPK